MELGTTREEFVAERTCGFCGISAYQSVVFLGRPLPTRESGKQVPENDEPRFNWSICLDGLEFVAATSNWIRCWRLQLLGWMLLGDVDEDEP